MPNRERSGEYVSTAIPDVTRLTVPDRFANAHRVEEGLVWEVLHGV